MSVANERRPLIGPVLSQTATLLAEWWLGFDFTAASGSGVLTGSADDVGSRNPARLGDGEDE